ncbi:mevalonate kinase [Candidatus Woesearchaeota archaeon]|nr:mevalonate kinase [Candidatus Woesearchaeota archaeon]
MRDTQKTTYSRASMILVGEHAVVYGQPAIAAGLHLGTSAEVTEGESYSETDGQPVPLTDRFREIAGAVERKLRVGRHEYTIHSLIPIGKGYGSSAALGAALARAISAHYSMYLTDGQICDAAYEVEKLMHGDASGIDNTVATYGGLIWFVKGRNPQQLRPKERLNIIVTDTGIPRNTKDAIAKAAQHPRREEIFTEIGLIAHYARYCIESADLTGLGDIMNQNHQLLQKLGVSHPSLDEICAAALGSGALGAKMTGGGLGGCAISLVTEETSRNVKVQLERKGYRSTSHKI